MAVSQENEQEEYTRLVHDALLHLYDVAALQSHPLLALLGLDGEPSRAARTQRARKMILDAIEAIKPSRGVPASSPLWRSYLILQKRFLDGRASTETMEQLGLGKSQFFLEQKRAIEALAAYLQARYPTPAAEPVSKASLASETDRLVRDCAGERVEVTEILRSIAALVAPLFDQSEMQLQLDPGRGMTVHGSDRVLLRQTILVLLSYLAEHRVCRQVEANFEDQGATQGVRFALRQPDQALREDLEKMRGLETCRRLAESAGCSLQVHLETTQTWSIRLEWTGEQEYHLMVVDDNQETANLFRRYLSCTPWKVTGAGSVAQAQALLRHALPTAITIDILMPDQDGWELLTSLKSSPAARDIPVLICSVLNEQQLARILGVAQYLPKPVSRDDLLHALDRVRSQS